MAITRKPATERKLPTSTPSVGHNKPPEAIWEEYDSQYEEFRTSAQKWLDFGDLEDKEAADAAAAFAKQIKAKMSQLEKARREITDPLNKQVKDVNEKFKGPKEKFDRLAKRLLDKINDYLKLERQRIAGGRGSSLAASQ